MSKSPANDMQCPRAAETLHPGRDENDAEWEFRGRRRGARLSADVDRHVHDQVLLITYEQKNAMLRMKGEKKKKKKRKAGERKPCSTRLDTVHATDGDSKKIKKQKQRFDKTVRRGRAKGTKRN